MRICEWIKQARKKAMGFLGARPLKEEPHRWTIPCLLLKKTLQQIDAPFLGAIPLSKYQETSLSQLSSLNKPPHTKAHP